MRLLLLRVCSVIIARSRVLELVEITYSCVASNHVLGLAEIAYSYVARSRVFELDVSDGERISLCD